MNSFILEAEYLEIILELLSERYKVNSLVKLVFMSFCVKNGKKALFSGRKRDFVDVFFSSINVKLLSHSNEMKSIFEVINKMKASGWIQVDGDEVKVLKNIDDFNCDNKFLVGCGEKKNNPIKEVNKLDSRAFLEEVLRHV